MIRGMSLKRKTHERGRGKMELTCARNVWFDIFWPSKITAAWLTYSGKTEVISKLYYVRSAHENVGGWVVNIFRKSEVIGKLYYVLSADENVSGSVVDIFRKNAKKLASSTTRGPPTKRGWYGGRLRFILGIR